ncbi:Sm-like protein lsm7 [Aphanomyces cochlioides]|nr:Sm-like protein lsm7 [Aphanomyces cochlioides]
MSGTKRDPILDLAKYIDQAVRGYDQLVNLVLDDAVEYFETPGKTRELGLLVCRGTSVMLISPVEGTEEIANPFAQEQEE